jgi:hypothetical protein
MIKLSSCLLSRPIALSNQLHTSSCPEKILVSNIAGPWHFGTDPDQPFSSVTFKTATKNYIFLKILLRITFLKGTFTSFFKNKSH